MGTPEQRDETWGLMAKKDFILLQTYHNREGSGSKRSPWKISSLIFGKGKMNHLLKTFAQMIDDSILRINTVGYYLAIKERYSTCSNFGWLKGYYTKWDNLDTEIQILCDLACGMNLKNF